MSQTTIPNLFLDTAFSNVVNTNTLNGSITNAINQASATTAVLGATSWASTSTVNGTNATFSHVSLLGANSNSVDNAALPGTLTSNVNNTQTAAVTYLEGTAGTGTQTTTISKNYSVANSNTALTIATISSVDNTASDQWIMDITVHGSTQGSSTGQAVYAAFTVMKAGVAGVWKQMNGLSFTSNSSVISAPTLTLTPASTQITVNQPSNGGATDGTVNYNVAVRFCGTNSAGITAPALS